MKWQHLVAGLLLLVAGTALIVSIIQFPTTLADAAGLFVEAAAESGIDFQMAYLPGEQGEKFKINLYDHGCGVAVADDDGDGHDDIYFVNQLGPNAPYRNKGDGTFTDVTEPCTN